MAAKKPKKPKKTLVEKAAEEAAKAVAGGSYPKPMFPREWSPTDEGCDCVPLGDFDVNNDDVAISVKIKFSAASFFMGLSDLRKTGAMSQRTLDTILQKLVDKKR